MSDALFWVSAAVLLASGIAVVRTRDVVRAVLWLALALLATAALFAYLDAPFLAGVQVLTYVGGVATLMIFGVMVTRRHSTAAVEASNDQNAIGVLAALAVFGVLAYAILNTRLPESGASPPDTRELARALVDEYLLAFEAVSLLLLAAIVGAVVIARRRDVESREAPGSSSLPSIRTEAD